MIVHGRVKQGVVVLEAGVSLPEGERVLVTVAAASAEQGAMTDEERSRYREVLARLDALPNENPGDDFRGADHDQALYGEAR